MGGVNGHKKEQQNNNYTLYTSKTWLKIEGGRLSAAGTEESSDLTKIYPMPKAVIALQLWATRARVCVFMRAHLCPNINSKLHQNPMCFRKALCGNTGEKNGGRMEKQHKIIYI